MEQQEDAGFSAPRGLAARAGRLEILSQSQRLAREDVIKKFVDHIFDMVVVLNKQRQIVLANRPLARYLKLADEKLLIGLRPGEALRCVHAFESSLGCGTTAFCSTCGTTKALLEIESGAVSVQECRITKKDCQEAIDLRVSANPLDLDGERYTIFAMMDISHEKRRRVLERIFFHDILNTAGGLHGLIQLLDDSEPHESNLYSNRLKSISDALINEIKTQRDLLAAESSELTLQVAPLGSKQVMSKMLELYRNHEAADGVHVRIDAEAADIVFESDPVLLHRVISNMVKNALEATDAKGTVTLGCKLEDAQVEFWVHNAQFIPHAVQLQVFQRSFSTKSSNRGLGTYSMKLLGEKYLGGRVLFTSSPEDGTTFKARFPVSIGR